MVSYTTVETKGAKEVSMKTDSNENYKIRYSLSVNAYGTK